MSTQMMDVLPRSKIATMSTGYFAGIVADTFEHQIKEKKCFGQLEPDIKAKERAMEYELPIVREFLPKDFDLKSNRLLRDLERNFDTPFLIGVFKKLQVQQVLSKTVLFNCIGELDCDLNRKIKMKELANEINLATYGNRLKDAISSGDSQKSIRTVFNAIIKAHLIELEIEKVTITNFENIITEVDTLVKNEYTALTGTVLKSAIFDEEKVNGEIATVLSNSDQAAKTFLDEFESGLANQNLETLSTLQEEDQMEKEEPFSSFPIESYE
jgi:hypothetical protein